MGCWTNRFPLSHLCVILSQNVSFNPQPSLYPCLVSHVAPKEKGLERVGCLDRSLFVGICAVKVKR